MASLILTIYFLIVLIFFIYSLQYRDKVDNILSELKISTFNALWLSYLEGLIIGGLSIWLIF
ncbi:MAG TPA: hypothetical protein QGI27_03040 [Flavobacteriaceae bacterium]|nr:hypothetical protein [Flavobacteriaceae bacterium]